MTIDANTIDAAKRVSTATVTTVLLKKGLRNVWMRGAVPLQPSQPRIAGPAFTLRFVPARVEIGEAQLAGVARSSRAGTKRSVKAGPAMRGSRGHA